MPLFFAVNKAVCTDYSDLCPGRFVYIRTGRFKLDLTLKVLIYLDDHYHDPYELKDLNGDLLYQALDVQPERDSPAIELMLKKDGCFYRMDGIGDQISIWSLFSKR